MRKTKFCNNINKSLLQSPTPLVPFSFQWVVCIYGKKEAFCQGEKCHFNVQWYPRNSQEPTNPCLELCQSFGVRTIFCLQASTTFRHTPEPTSHTYLYKEIRGQLGSWHFSIHTQVLNTYCFKNLVQCQYQEKKREEKEEERRRTLSSMKKFPVHSVDGEVKM